MTIEKFITNRIPRYSNIKILISALNGMEKSSIDDLLDEILKFDLERNEKINELKFMERALFLKDWITKNITNKNKEVAIKIIMESKGEIRISSMYHFDIDFHSNFIAKHNLLSVDDNGVLKITDNGELFIRDDFKFLFELDKKEGIFEIIKNYIKFDADGIPYVKGYSPPTRTILKSNWYKFYNKEKNKELLFGTKNRIDSSFDTRFENLISRGILSYNSNIPAFIATQLTETGKNYIESLKSIDSIDNIFSRQDELQKLKINTAIQRWKHKTEKEILSILEKINPYKFEEIIGKLLVAMKYTHVQVTKKSGDKGIDVIAKLEYGFSTIIDAIQVKRQTSNIQRKIIDELRGSLHYYNSTKGTIITLGGFSKGCEESAQISTTQTISLIDGQKLAELLIKHNIGVKKTSIDLISIDHDFFEKI